MKNILISFLITVLVMSLGMEGYEAYASGQQAEQAADNGVVYNQYEAHAGEETEVSVLLTLTIDENGNIVG